MVVVGNLFALRGHGRLESNVGRLFAQFLFLFDVDAVLGGAVLQCVLGVDLHGVSKVLLGAGLVLLGGSGGVAHGVDCCLS